MNDKQFLAYMYTVKGKNYVDSFDTRYYGIPRIGESIRVQSGCYRIIDILRVIGNDETGRPTGLIDIFVKKVTL